MDADDELTQMFIEEAQELLANTEQALLSLESRPADEELIARVFRCAHTLKGNAKMLQFEAIASFTHELENLLDKVRRQQLLVSKPVTETLLTAFDMVKGMVEHLAGGPAHDAIECEKLRVGIEELVADFNVVLPSEKPAPRRTVDPRPSTPEDVHMSFRAPEPRAETQAPALIGASEPPPPPPKVDKVEAPPKKVEAPPKVEPPTAKVEPPKPAAIAEPERKQFVTFTVGNGEYGLEILDVREFKAYGAITHVPNMPAFLRGVMNLRGIIIPVFDLRVRFGQNAARNETTVIVVAEVEGRTSGLVVDAVSDVIDLDVKDISDTPELATHEATSFLRGLAKLEDRLIMLLNLEELIAIEERAA
ncbi:MAG: chemotaxis protein CheW [Polyangiales bacterium]